MKIHALKKSVTFAEEALVVDIQSFLQTLMDEKEINRAQLADAMGVTRGRVSQMFSSDCKNFTVRLLARALHALGEKAELTCEGHRKILRKSLIAQLECAKPHMQQEASWSKAFSAVNDHLPHFGGDIEVATGQCDRIGKVVRLFEAERRRVG